MPDRAWRNLARHLEERDRDLAALDERIEELAAKYTDTYRTPWTDAYDTLTRRRGSTGT